jgi:aspartyl-tRNA synthetase
MVNVLVVTPNMEISSKTRYRTHTCGELSLSNVGQIVVLSGFIHRVRDHGGLLFVDLRDHYGLIQCVTDQSTRAFSVVEGLKDESIVSITGKILKRSLETINESLKTGEVEVSIGEIEVLSAPEQPLPLSVNAENEYPEETRLRYRFLDLRRTKIHNNIVLRSKVISHIRQLMTKSGFLEIQTPILTASSPEGARDYLVPSRNHPGKFYALPQAPQQFKQLLMVSGFDKYFQIAPCFRDEDARADRSPGEFYQLDLEMAFVSQEDVFAAVEPVLYSVFKTFGQLDFEITEPPFQRITYHDAVLHYGCDKPDLRNPLIIIDVTQIFENSLFTAFSQAAKEGSVIRSINVPSCAKCPRSFFDKLNDWAKEVGLPGLGYISKVSDNEYKGPIAKFLNETELNAISIANDMAVNDSVFFICDKKAASIAGKIRMKLGEDLGLIDEKCYKFCWIVDFPMYEYDEDAKKVIFSHNPFSMPQGGMAALSEMNPLDVKAYQYDIVCNGVELSSGAIRNHIPEIMYKAFEIAGYTKEDVDAKFGAMIKAFRFGSPPHGGCAPGIDRIVMLLANCENIREVIAFPFNQQAEDLMIGAPAEIEDKQLKELHIQTRPLSNPL